MGMREAVLEDWEEISNLLNQLDYLGTEAFIKGKMEKLLEHPDEKLLIYESEGKVIAFISLHFIPQIALEGDFARISYFAVDKATRSKGIGREIEEFCVDIARERKCDRIEVHCHSRRTDAHRFYFGQGYIESPKYLMKKIN
jgi:GNAT superfamily N-acetyltransferase